MEDNFAVVYLDTNTLKMRLEDFYESYETALNEIYDKIYDSDNNKNNLLYIKAKPDNYFYVHQIASIYGSYELGYYKIMKLKHKNSDSKPEPKVKVHSSRSHNSINSKKKNEQN